GHLPVVPDFETVLGDVDQDVPLAEILRQPAPAFEIQLELPNALLDGHVHLRGDRWSDGAVGFEAVAPLKALDRLLEFRRIARVLVVNGAGVITRDRKAS